MKTWNPNEREVSHEWVEFSSDSSVDELDSDEDMWAVISDGELDSDEAKFEKISDGGDWTVSSMNELEPQPEDMFEVIPDDGDSQDGSPLTSSLSRPAVESEAGSNPLALALPACLKSILQPSDNSKASVDLLAYDRVRRMLGGGFPMCAADYHHAFGPITSDAPFGMHVFTGLFDKLRREYCLFARHGWYFQQALQTCWPPACQSRMVPEARALHNAAGKVVQVSRHRQCPDMVSSDVHC